MICKNCGQDNQEGKFCQSCGANLAGDSNEETAAVVETHGDNTHHSSQTEKESNLNEYLEKTKDISKTYFSYFTRVLKSPLTESQTIRKEEFVNGIITIVLYALLIPLMAYLSLGSARHYMASPFFNVFFKPALGYTVFIFLIAGFSFLAIQLGKAKADIKDVIARFGALLVPFIVIFVIAFILALLQTGFYAVVLSLGLMGSIMAVPPLVIYSYKKDVKGGLDTLYGVLLTYILTSITLGIMSAILIENILGNFGGLFNHLW